MITLTGPLFDQTGNAGPRPPRGRVPLRLRPRDHRGGNLGLLRSRQFAFRAGRATAP